VEARPVHTRQDRIIPGDRNQIWIDKMLIVCGSCKKEKHESCFSKKSASKNGYSSKCKECHNLYSRIKWYPENRQKQMASSSLWKSENKARCLSRAHGLDLSLVVETLKKSDGKCAICGKQDDLVLDHCHDKLVPRGVLCRTCNLLVGRLGDTVEKVVESTNRILTYLRNA